MLTRSSRMPSGTSFARSVILNLSLNSIRSSFWTGLPPILCPLLSLRMLDSMKRALNSSLRNSMTSFLRPFITVFTTLIPRVESPWTKTLWESLQTPSVNSLPVHKSTQLLLVTGTQPSFKRPTSVVRRERRLVLPIMISVKILRAEEKDFSCATVLSLNATLSPTTTRPSTTSENGRCF